jgi:plastocyanin
MRTGARGPRAGAAARLAGAAAALACTVLLPGAVGALAVVGLSAAASAEQPAAVKMTHHGAARGDVREDRRISRQGTAKTVCRRRRHHKRCVTSKGGPPARGDTHTPSGPAAPRSTNAATPASPRAPASSTPAPGLPSTPPGEVPPPGVAPNPVGPGHVQVSAKEFSFTLSRPSVAGGPLVIELVNAGQDEHDLHIRPAAGGADVGAFSIVQPGHHTDIEFNLPPGSYTFYCSMPGHEALGMKATFTVE